MRERVRPRISRTTSVFFSYTRLLTDIGGQDVSGEY